MSVGRLTQAQAHAYWRTPDDGNNDPRSYLDDSGETPQSEMRRARSEALVNLVQDLAEDVSILELGCNAGRNLKYLQAAGFERLTAIEISKAAIDVMREAEPNLHASVVLFNGPIEEVLPDLGAFDVVVAMAVLLHIPIESEWIFAEIAKRVRRRLVLVEFEAPHDHPRVFPRNYGSIFEKLGLRQTREIHPFPGMIKAYVGRVFEPVQLREEEPAQA